jgi:hypothetical protein
MVEYPTKSNCHLPGMQYLRAIYCPFQHNNDLLVPPTDLRYVISLEIKLLGLWYLTTLSTIFQAVSFIGGGNGSTRRKPPTLRKSLESLIA